MANGDLDMDVIALVNAKNRAKNEVKENQLVKDLESQYGILMATKGGKEMLAEAAEVIRNFETRFQMAEMAWKQREQELKASLEKMTAERDHHRKTAIAWHYQAMKNRKTEVANGRD